MMASSLFLKALKASFFSVKRPSDVLSLIDNHDGRYVAILFESNSSYVGREVPCGFFPVCPRGGSRVLGLQLDPHIAAASPCLVRLGFVPSH